MGRTRKTAHASLGMSLVKKKKPQWNRTTNAEHAIVEDNTTNALKSVTEESSYDEFIATATLANKEFTAEKLNVKFVALSTTKGDQENQITEEEKRMVVVPRRPKWTREMTGEELDVAEREAFLEWRRHMAHLQNKEGITPFERNIEVWRQLWRVIERSNIVVQIVDARTPLLFRCEDLEAYVKEMGKTNVLLINKADFLTSKQRKYWSDYFNSIGLAHAFYSAVAATTKSKSNQEVSEESEDEESEESGDEDEENEHSGDGDGDDEGVSDESENEADGHGAVYLGRGLRNDDDGSLEEETRTKILTREELIGFLRTFKVEEDLEDGAVFAVGLVGYPNVGKSSTINSLMSAKKTSVSATPGKTKHFQTLFLEEDILLCDCPGLVMPAFGGSKGEMVLGGILPIDQLTSYDSSADLLVKRIPLPILEDTYGVNLPSKYTYEDFLSSYAALRGFMTVRGIPDCSRAARIVLKDYVNGKLCYCDPPPNVPEEDFASPPPVPRKRHQKNLHQDEAQQANRRPANIRVRVEKALDRQFFTPSSTFAHIKGKQYIATGGASTSTSSSLSTLESKPWKKHNNRNKKEKLRRVYRHLDVE